MGGGFVGTFQLTSRNACSSYEGIVSKVRLAACSRYRWNSATTDVPSRGYIRTRRGRGAPLQPLERCQIRWGEWNQSARFKSLPGVSIMGPVSARASFKIHPSSIHPLFFLSLGQHHLGGAGEVPVNLRIGRWVFFFVFRVTRINLFGNACTFEDGLNMYVKMGEAIAKI